MGEGGMTNRPPCRDCRCFQPRPELSVLPASLMPAHAAPTTFGECRAYPPIVNPLLARTSSNHPHTGRWPGVEDSDWCNAFIARDTGQGA